MTWTRHQPHHVVLYGISNRDVLEGLDLGLELFTTQLPNYRILQIINITLWRITIYLKKQPEPDPKVDAGDMYSL